MGRRGPFRSVPAAALAWLLLPAALVLLLGLVSAKPAPADNPCAGLPLCVLKKDVAERLGVPASRRPTNAPKVFRPRRPLPPKRPEPEPETEVVEEQEEQLPKSVNRRPPPIRTFRPRKTTPRPAVADDDEPSGNENNACAGLRFCVLSKDVSANKRRRPSTSSSSSPSRRRQNVATAVARATTTTTTIAPIVFSTESLMKAVLNGHIDDALQMIADGSDVNAEDVHGNSVLHIAAQNGRTGVIKALLLKGAAVNKGNNHRNTALHLAAQNGWTEIARILLTHKRIDMNSIDFHGNTAMHLAAQNGQIGVVEELLKAEAKVNRPNAHQMIPLHLAVQNGHYNLSEMLVVNGADLDHPDNIGNTPLHTAYHSSHTEIAQMLIGYGANTRAKNLANLRPAALG